MKFTKMSLENMVPNKQGVLEVSFSNGTDLDRFLVELKNTMVNGVIDPSLDPYIPTGKDSGLKACINLPMEGVYFRQAEKDAVIERIKKLYPDAYNYAANFVPKARPTPVLSKSLRDYFAHLYRAPSRHPKFVGIAAAALIGLGLLYFSAASLFTAIGVAMFGGAATFVGLKVREAYYGSARFDNKTSIQQPSREAYSHGRKAGADWKPYLISFGNYKDYLYIRTFGNAMVVRMDELERNESSAKNRSRY